MIAPPRRSSKEGSEDSEFSMVSEYSLQVTRLAENDPGIRITQPSELNRFLSLRSIVSTTPSSAERHTAAAAFNHHHHFNKIGKGTCGVVFEAPGTSIVWKQALPTHDDHLWYEYKQQLRIYDVFTNGLKNVFPEFELVHVPAAEEFIRADSADWWATNAGRFPPEWQEPVAVRASERIFPLPLPARNALIDTYCPPNLIAHAKAHPANAACIARVYLGKHRPQRTFSVLKAKTFTLQNFALHFDDILAHDLGMTDLTRKMAVALAVCHWKLKNDANDVEFVLGSTPERVHRPDPDELGDMVDTWNVSFRRREVNLWMLDFDKVRAMEWNEAGVEQAVKAAELNDPYFPKPTASSQGGLEESIWGLFKMSYMTASRKLAEEHDDATRGRILELAELFLTQWEDLRVKKEEGMKEE